MQTNSISAAIAYPPKIPNRYLPPALGEVPNGA